MAVLRGYTAAGAVLNLRVLVAVAAGNILGIDQGRLDAGEALALQAVADIIPAGIRCQLAGVGAYTHRYHLAGIVQGHIFLPFMQGAHYLFEQVGCRIVNPVSVRIGCTINDLRGVKTGPNSGSIVAGEAAVPAVLVIGGGTGLTCCCNPVTPRQIRFRTGSLLGTVLHTIVHIVYSLFAENLLRLLGVVQHQVAVAVIHLGKGSALPVYAVVGKGSKGSGHIPHLHTEGLGTHSQRSKSIVRMDRSAGIGIAVHQRGQPKLVLGKLIAVAGANHIQGIGCDGVDGGYHATVNRPGILVPPIVVQRPGAVIVIQRQILDHSSRRNGSQFKSRCVNGQRLDGRTGLELGIGCPIKVVKALVVSHTAGHAHNIAGTVVDDHDGRLELLSASGIRNLGQILIDSINLVLHVHINGGVDIVAASLDLLHIKLLGIVVPGHSVLLSQSLGHILQNGIHKPGVHFLGAVLVHQNLGAAFRAVVLVFLLHQGAYNVLVAAAFVGAGGQGVFQGDAVFQNQFLIPGLFKLLLGNPALLQHLLQHQFLTAAVPLHAGHQLALVHKFLTVGVEQGGVIGDADEAGALCQSEHFQFLAKVGLRSAADTVAHLSHIDGIEVLLHNLLFAVLPLHLDGTENLNHLPLHGDVIGGVIALQQQHILYQLLGNAGAAHRGVAEEHSGAGLDGGKPVHTLMLVEAPVLNGNSSVNQVLGNLVIGGPFPVGLRIDSLQQLNLSILVQIPDLGCHVQVAVFKIHACIGQDVLLQVVAQGGGKHEKTHHTHKQNRGCRSKGNLEAGKQDAPGSIQRLYGPMGFPILGIFIFF